ncbi:hypothetical protein CK203_005362 [Vitis vinifera]|uniref:Uncharacterized protein n=1 Tax=Vitis vinifera TaxID=29760 RepID=A0A438KEG2_VITVI|nr:hypothetical protein CK203_005362 [Vitis vinifera]
MQAQVMLSDIYPGRAPKMGSTYWDQIHEVGVISVTRRVLKRLHEFLEQQNWETLKRELMASVTGFHESLRSVIATSIMLVLKKGGAYVLKGNLHSDFRILNVFYVQLENLESMLLSNGAVDSQLRNGTSDVFRKLDISKLRGPTTAISLIALGAASRRSLFFHVIVMGALSRLMMGLSLFPSLLYGTRLKVNLDESVFILVGNMINVNSVSVASDCRITRLSPFILVLPLVSHSRLGWFRSCSAEVQSEISHWKAAGPL